MDALETFTQDQRRAWDAMQSYHSVFLTGAAGSGKSYLVSRFAEKFSCRTTFPILASTGAAAVLIGGRTFHSFFGLGLMNGTRADIIHRAVSDRNVSYRLRNAKKVVIDEISMLPGEALSVAEEITRRIRKSSEPWGGLSLILVGDFAQLPPVSRERHRPWAFAHPIWAITAPEPFVLQEIVRSKDPYFLSVLQSVRLGQANDDVRSFLAECKAKKPADDVTRLFPRKAAVETYNRMQLSKVSSLLFEIPTAYSGQKVWKDRIKKEAPIPEVLQLKVGALVMIRVNDPKQRFINGTTGRVMNIDDDCIIVSTKNRVIELERSVFHLHNGDGEVVATASNYPLNLAWAMTIHKAQGATLDQALVDLKGLWEPGHAYVAMSRVRTSEGLYLEDWSESSLYCDGAVQEFYRQGCPIQFAENLEWMQMTDEKCEGYDKV